MTFTSYAQNFEDVMLWRALGHVPRGCYIDIGAQDPLLDSVSKGFYEKGWRGLHVEPVPHYAEMLRRDRPDENVLEMALSDSVGLLQLSLIPGTGLSTGVKAQAEEHRIKHGLESRTIVVPAMPMRDAFASLNGQDVHWLKIDVEGMEGSVLRGWDSSMLRPWILVVESTSPLSQDPTQEHWEHIVLAAGYQFAYFDGLNRFYVANEHGELAQALLAPPNVFDDVQLSGMSGPWCRLVNSKLAAATTKLSDEAARNAEQIVQMQKAHAEQILQMQNAHAEQIEQMQNAHALQMQQGEAVERDLQRQLVSTIERHEALESELRAALADERHQAAQVRLQLDATKRQTENLRTHLEAILASTSWRVTAPVRVIGHPIARLRAAAQEDRIRSGMKRRLIAGLQPMVQFAQAHPSVKKAAIGPLRLFPPVHRRMRAWFAPAQTEHGTGFAPQTERTLSPTAQEIFDQLSALIASNRRIEN